MPAIQVCVLVPVHASVARHEPATLPMQGVHLSPLACNKALQGRVSALQCDGRLSCEINDSQQEHW